MLREQRGYALLLVVVTGLLITLALLAAQLQLDLVLRQVTSGRGADGALLLAMAGHEEARARLQDREYDLQVRSTWTELPVANAGSYEVQITRPGGNEEQREVRSIGRVGGDEHVITRTYGFKAAKRLESPLLAGSDLYFANLSGPFPYSIRAGGDILIGNQAEIDPQAAGYRYMAVGQIYVGPDACISGPCRPLSPVLDLPMPRQPDLEAMATWVITLTPANTDGSGRYFVGGLAGNYAAGAIDDQNAHDFDTSADGRVVLIKGDGQRTYTVVFADFVYQGTGTFAIAADVGLEFSGDAAIRRATEAPSSCMAILPFTNGQIVLPSGLQYEGVLIARSLLFGTDIQITGAVVGEQVDVTNVTSLQLIHPSAPDFLAYAPSTIPQAVDTFVISP